MFVKHCETTCAVRIFVFYYSSGEDVSPAWQEMVTQLLQFFFSLSLNLEVVGLSELLGRSK